MRLAIFSGQNIAALILMLVIAALGGAVFQVLGTPMPFLLGSLVASAFISLRRIEIFGIAPKMPMPIRNTFIAVIGVMIGGNFSASQLSHLSNLWGAAIVVPFFVVAALAANYAIFRVLGRYDRNTAFFAAMPGGLIETIAFGEKLGADIQVLTLQQFSRIVLVISVLPFIFLLWTGEKVGSAAGISLEDVSIAISFWDIFVLTMAGTVGLYVGRVLKLPAAFLVGPLIVSALVHLGGLTDATPPAWFISLAQMIIGAGLGARFAGFRIRVVFKALGLAVISVTVMMLIDAAIVLVLSRVLGMPFDVLLISFAPGGVTETALIALSLDANPVFVTTLHIIRIVVTVVLSSIGFRKLAKADKI